MKRDETRYKKIPTGVKVIAVLYYIIAIMAIINLIILLLIGGSYGISLFFGNSLNFLGINMLIVSLALMLLLSFLGFYVGRGLWNGKYLARNIAIILSVLAIIFTIISMIGGEFNRIFVLILHLIIGGYLILSKKVKKTFSREKLKQKKHPKNT